MSDFPFTELRSANEEDKGRSSESSSDESAWNRPDADPLEREANALWHGMSDAKNDGQKFLELQPVGSMSSVIDAEVAEYEARELRTASAEVGAVNFGNFFFRTTTILCKTALPEIALSS